MNKKYTEKQLANEIRKHNKLYWENNIPEISDEEYDELIQQLEEINPNNPVLHEVGSAGVASLGKINIDEPMISLEKTYFFKDAPKGKKSLLKWASEIMRNRNEVFLIEPKYDGISAIYSNGILATRGQGTEEENVTDKVPLIELESINYTGQLNRPVRGEIIIRNDDFKNIYSKIKKGDGTPYKNSRNAVGGIMGLKDITNIKEQGAKLTLVDFNMVSYSVKYQNIEKKWESLLEKIESLPYPMDGIVIKLADKKYRESLGYTAHHPRGQIAFKFSGVRKKAELVDVVWSFGKNCLTPVGKIEPVEIGGVTITNVTLHNIAMVQENDWRIGDVITIERAGDVIPHIVASEPGKTRKYFIIDKCPSCNHKLIVNNKELRCLNPDCFEIKLQRLLAAVKNIGIEELGEPNIRKMMKILSVKSLNDIFKLSMTDIFQLEGFKEKSTKNLYDNIQSAKKTTDFQLLAALNIEGIGQTLSKKILKDYTLSEIKKMSILQLSFIPEIGIETSQKLYNDLAKKTDIINELLEILDIAETKKNKEPHKLICFDIETNKLKKNIKHYENLIKLHNFNRVKAVQLNSELHLPTNLQVLVTTKNKNSNTKIILKTKENNIPIMSPDEWEYSLPETAEGKKFIEKKSICFTGKMPEKRSYYEDIAESRGFKAVNKVNKDLDLLVAADPDGSSSKIKKAKNSKIKVISLEEWLSNNAKDDKKDSKEDSGQDEQDLLPGFQ
jgi:DNA ligase (NAD+)